MIFLSLLEIDSFNMNSSPQVSFHQQDAMKRITVEAVADIVEDGCSSRVATDLPGNGFTVYFAEFEEPDLISSAENDSH